MSRWAQAALLLAVALYLGASVLPCPPAGGVDATDGADVVVSVFCPCHTGHGAASGVVGADWQGPRTGATEAFALSRAPFRPAAAPRAPWRALRPPAPIPIV